MASETSAITDARLKPLVLFVPVRTRAIIASDLAAVFCSLVDWLV